MLKIKPLVIKVIISINKCQNHIGTNAQFPKQHKYFHQLHQIKAKFMH